MKYNNNIVFHKNKKNPTNGRQNKTIVSDIKVETIVNDL